GQARQSARIVLTGVDPRDQQRPHELRILHGYPVNLRIDLAVQAAVIGVARHSHYGRRLIPYKQQPMADGALIWKESPRKCFVDDRHSRRFRAVLRCERSTGANLYTHRLKVIGADEIGVNSRRLSPRFMLLTSIDLNTDKAASRPGER